MINLVKRIVLIVLLEPIAHFMLMMETLGMGMDRMMEPTSVYHNIVLHPEIK